jgi:hypothetical protein
VQSQTASQWEPPERVFSPTIDQLHPAIIYSYLLLKPEKKNQHQWVDSYYKAAIAADNRGGALLV